MPATDTLPMVLDEVEVRRVERLSPSFVRLWLGGACVADLGVDGPFLDQRIKLVLPSRADGRLPEVDRSHPDGWYAAWLAVPEEERGHMRTYTVRAVRDGADGEPELLVDVVVHEHGPVGPGCAWALGARPGDRALLCGPRRGHFFGGIEFEPGTARRLLLVADETAVPAVTSILESLPVDAVGSVYLEVPTTQDVLDVRAPAGVRVTWLPREGAEHGTRTLSAVGALFGMTGARASDSRLAVDPDLWETPTHSSSGEPLEDGAAVEPDLYAWIAGESRMVTRLRRLLVRDVGLARRQVAFMGYWRQGVAMKG